MQQSPLTLRQKLIDAVDESYHVKDMATIVEVLGTLERLPVTKELLETTRLGKTVNEFRRRINNDKLAKRAKALVKKWRDAVLQPLDSQQSGRPLNGNSSSSVVSEGPSAGPGQASHPHHPPVSSLGSLQQSYGIGLGYNSTSSSPKLTSSSKFSPLGSQNSNSLSPRILTTYNSNSTNNNKNGSSHNTIQESISNRSLLSAAGAVSSPLLNSTSPHVSSPSSTTYLSNKPKPSFGPTSSVYTQQSSNKSPLLSSSSYAPNSEIVSKTNAANKRLRIDDDTAVGVNSGPPLKKARKLLNGTGIVGTLDDPLIFDELSKDSVISRTSDHSDGSSKSKPVSYVSSGAILSAAPSPLAITQDSISPPLSVGIGASSSAALIISNDQSLSSQLQLGIENTGAEQPPGEVPPVQVGSKRGRKKKKKEVFDSESLLREKIAKAQAAGKIRAIESVSREIIDDENSRSSNLAAAEENLRKSQLAALSREDPVVKNEIVEKYLKSQNELIAQMERQYQDAVARNEFHVEDDNASTNVINHQKTTGTGEDGKSKSKKKKDKKKDKKDGSAVGSSFATESEILARLPAIDPAVLAEFKNFVYYTDPEPEEDQKEPKSENETENLINKSTSLSSSNQQTNIDEPKKLIATKIDWGDSDEEDEDFEEVKIPEPKEKQELVEEDILDGPIAMAESPDPPVVVDITATLNDSVPKPLDVVQVEEKPLREVDESEVERLLTQNIDNLNGNTDKDGQFRQWQEVVTVESFNGDLLHILPYSIIDF